MPRPPTASYSYSPPLPLHASLPFYDLTRRYFRKLDRYSANLALIAAASMLLLGGKLKFKESLSGRLGDVLSHLYMTSAMLKRYKDEGCPVGDQPPLAWAFHDSVHRTELAHARKSVVSGTRVPVRVGLGGRRFI